MKKFLFTILFAFICISGFSQTIRYRATEYAFGNRNTYGSITWGDWEKSNVVITLDLDNDYIKVYSTINQDYVVTDSGDTYTDNSGGSNADFYAIDEEGISCQLRLRIEKNGNGQFYVYYKNIAWVYSGLKKY